MTRKTTNKNSTLKTSIVLLSTLPTLLTTREVSPFLKNSRYGCEYHPADPNPKKPTCLPKNKPTSLVKNCDFQVKGICIQCSDHFYLSFPEIECKPCAKGCKFCDGPLEKIVSESTKDIDLTLTK